MQLIGTDTLRNHFNPDIWFLTLENRIRKNPHQHVVISDVRFQNEVKFIKEQQGILIHITRGPLPVWYETALMANKGNSLAKEAMAKTYSAAHASEWSWIGSEFNFVINNDGSLESMKEQTREIISKIL